MGLVIVLEYMNQQVIELLKRMEVVVERQESNENRCGVHLQRLGGIETEVHHLNSKSIYEGLHCTA
jgi:hypothetical protein